MAPTLKLALAACVVGASATAGNHDAAALVQHVISTHDPDDVMLARVHTSARMRRFAKSLMFSVVGNGRRWSKLLYGNETVAAIPAPAAPSGVGIGCSAADRESFMNNAATIMNDVQSKVQEQAMKVMAGHMMSDGDGDSSPFLPMAGGQEQLPINIGELANIPEVCESVMNTGPDSDMSWNMVKSCVQEAMKVSDSCVQCIPAFGASLQQKCEAVCHQGMIDAEDKLNEVQKVLGEKMMKSGGAAGLPGMASMPDMEEMQSMAQVLTDQLNGALKVAVPCGECVTPAATEFAGCLMGEDAKAEAEGTLRSLIDGLKDGGLKVEVVGPGAAGGGSQSQMPMPM